MRQLAEGQARGHVRVDAFVGESRGREESVEVLDALCRAAGFFFQLARRARGWVFMGTVQLSGRDLVDEVVCGVAILLYQQELRIFGAWIREKWQDCAGAGMSHHLELPFRAIGKSNGVTIHADDFALVDTTRLQGAHSTSPCVSYTVTPPKRSVSSGARTLSRSPTTTICSAAGSRWSRATRNTSSVVTART